MAEQLLRDGVRDVLEPSAGDGVFIDALADVARRRGLGGISVTAVEVDEDTFCEHLTSFPEGVVGTGVLSDFLGAELPRFDAVIGNPPFVRLRNLAAAERTRAEGVAGELLGSAMDPAGSVWMPFVLRAADRLREGGRLALVLPYEFTYVRYARPLWSFLSGAFGSLRVLRSYERMFPEILQDVVLLFAEDKGGTTSSVTFEVFESLVDVLAGEPDITTKIEVADAMSGRPFVEALLPEDVRTIVSRVAAITVPASQIARFNIGYVCGDKSFFHPDPETVREFGIPDSSLRSAVGSTRMLRGTGLFTTSLPSNATTGLFLPGHELTPGESRYVEHGESLGVNERYKCRIREPWFGVPYVHEPDLILSVFAETPVLLVNDGKLVASNSLLCGYLEGATSAEDFARAWYSSLSLLSIELNVHALGGGVFVFVPREAGRVLIANPQLMTQVDLAEIHRRLRSSSPRDAYEVGDECLRSEGVLADTELEAVGAARAVLARWRTRATS